MCLADKIALVMRTRGGENGDLLRKMEAAYGGMTQRRHDLSIFTPIY